MGNSSSRRVTIVNDDTVGIVQISDSVVKRLRTNPDKEPEKPKSEQAESEKHRVQEPSPTVQKVLPMPSETFVSSLEQRQKFHQEFKQAKASWQKRIDDLEQKNDQLLKAAEGKLAAEISKVEGTYMKQTFEPVCPDKQEKVLKCYQENLKRPLMCAQEVKAFTKCLEETRKTIISS